MYTLLLQLFCLYKGYTIKELKDEKALKASFDLKNRVHQELYGLPPLPENDEFVYPYGGAYFLGIYKNQEMIGCVHLMDLSMIEAYVSKLYDHVDFDYNGQTTYEIKSLVVDLNHQDAMGTVYKILIYYCMLHTIKMNRHRWVVVTRDTFYQLIKRSGLKTELISTTCQVKKDDTPQSRYYQNYDGMDILEGVCSYYIDIPRNATTIQMKKFFRRRFRKSVKRFRKYTQFEYLRCTKNLMIGHRIKIIRSKIKITLKE